MKRSGPAFKMALGKACFAILPVFNVIPRGRLFHWVLSWAGYYANAETPAQRRRYLKYQCMRLVEDDRENAEIIKFFERKTHESGQG